MQWAASDAEMIETIRALQLPPGDGYAWCAGEAAAMVALRGILVNEKCHDQRCVLLGGALGGAFYLAIVLVPVWPLAAICTTGLGFAFYMMHNTLQMKATEMAPQSRATALSLFAMFWAAGQAGGAALMGGAVAAFGYMPMIIAFGIAYALLGVGLRYNLQRL